MALLTVFDSISTEFLCWSASTDLLYAHSWFELLKQGAGIWASRSTCICSRWQYHLCWPKVKLRQPSHSVTPTLPAHLTPFTMSLWKLQIKTSPIVPGTLEEEGICNDFCTRSAVYSTDEHMRKSPIYVAYSRLHLGIFYFPSIRNWLSDMCLLVNPRHILASFPAANVLLPIKCIWVSYGRGNLKGYTKTHCEKSSYFNINNFPVTVSLLREHNVNRFQRIIS